MATKYKNPVDIVAGTDFPAGTNIAIFDGVNSSLDFRGWQVSVERIQAGTMTPGVDYSWDQATGLLTLLQVGDIFSNGERFHVSFFLKPGAFDGENSFGFGAGPFQYFHTLKYEKADQSGSTTSFESVEFKCRYEYKSGAIEGVGNNMMNFIGVVYAPKPVVEIPRGTTVKVFEGETMIASGTVKQFRSQLMNVRIWV